MLGFCFRELVPFVEIRIPRGSAGLGEINQGETFQELTGSTYPEFAREVWTSDTDLWAVDI